jgi:UDP-glucose 4-epimerase
LKAKILVTGGLGYLGGRTAIHFLLNNYEVRIATTKNLPKVDYYFGCELVKISWENLESLQIAIKDVDYIIHTTGLNSIDCENNPLLALNINVMGTANLLKAVQKSNRIQKFIYFSTAHVYMSPLTGIIDEMTFTSNLHPYATSHRAAEDVVLYSGLKNIPTTIVLRLSNAYGAPINPENNCWMLLINDLCRQAVVNKRLNITSNTNQFRDFISISQILLALNFIIEQKCDSGIYNLGSGTSKSITDLAEIIQNRTNLLYGYRPEIQFNNNFNYKTSNNRFTYKVDKLESVGFKINNTEFDEIDSLLNFCKTKFLKNND